MRTHLPALSLSPVGFPPFGTFHLSLVGLIQLPTVGIPAPAGRASLQFRVPHIAALVGQTVYFQAFTVHGLGPLDAHFTNVDADRIVK